LPANKKKLLEYVKYLEASGKSLPRRDKLLRTVKIFASLLGSIRFKKAVKKDVVNALAKYVERLARTEPNMTSFALFENGTLKPSQFNMIWEYWLWTAIFVNPHSFVNFTVSAIFEEAPH